MNLRLNSNIIITNEAGKFLLVKLKSGPFADGLCLPGGGINPGELGYETAIRETLEETGVHLSEKPELMGVCELIKKNIDSHRVVLLFSANSSEKNAFETEEGKASWWDYDSAEQFLIPFAKESIKMWGEGKKYFSIIE